jgi:hypothetical protein
MVPTIFAAILDGTPQFTASKPSDVLGIAVMGGLFLFALWVCFVVGKNLQAFMKGIAWIVALAIIGIVLIVIFQAGHPGQ